MQTNFLKQNNIIRGQFLWWLFLKWSNFFMQGFRPDVHREGNINDIFKMTEKGWQIQVTQAAAHFPVLYSWQTGAINQGADQSTLLWTKESFLTPCYRWWPPSDGSWCEETYLPHPTRITEVSFPRIFPGTTYHAKWFGWDVAPLGKYVKKLPSLN